MYSREQFAEKLGADGDPKLNAAADFTARLLNGPLGERVARVVLFGSVAGGVARPNSDVDVMVFADVSEPRLSEITADAAWEATTEFGELVSPLTYSLHRLYYRRPYVVYNALKRGQEIYTMDEAEERLREALNLYNKAQHHLGEAQTIFQQGLYTFATVAAYTAAELAAKALVILRPNVELPYTHGGMIQMFSREYVKTGEVPRDWGRLLETKLQLRSRALYETNMTPEKDDAASVMELAQNLLDFLRLKLKPILGREVL